MKIRLVGGSRDGEHVHCVPPFRDFLYVVAPMEPVSIIDDRGIRPCDAVEVYQVYILTRKAAEYGFRYFEYVFDDS